MFKRLVAILVAVTLTTLAGVSPAGAYEGETYEELIEDQALNDQHAVIIRFYAAVFGRTPDNEGVRYWLDQYDTGEWSTRRIADFFATSDEFTGLYGENTTNAQFVDSVYPNVLGRQPDAEGRTFWIGFLDAGNSRAELILLISNAPEFIDANRFPFEYGASTCGLDVAVTTADESDPIVGDDEFVVQLVTITTTPNANCGTVDGFAGTIGWQQGTLISEGSAESPVSIDEPRTQEWTCEIGQQAWIEWSIRSVETVNDEPALGVASSGSASFACNTPPPPPECSFTPSVTLFDSFDNGLEVSVDLVVEVEVTDCDFAMIKSSIDGFTGPPFDQESSSSPHSVANPTLLCGGEDSYVVTALDGDGVQIGSSFSFSASADDFEPCQVN